ncbi:MAG: hypothetical protein WCP17_02670 [bacterium]
MKFQPDNAPTNKYSPEQKERIRFLLEMADKNLSSPNTIGYHGAGLATLKLLIQGGKFPGKAYEEGTAFKKGDLHFFPLVKGFPNEFSKAYLVSLMDLSSNDLNIESLNEEYGTNEATKYAKSGSQRQIFMEVAKLDITNKEHCNLMDELLPISYKTEEAVGHISKIYNDPVAYEQISTIAKKLNLDKQKLIDIIMKVAERMQTQAGFVFALDKKILKEYEIKGGDQGSDLYINCPDGLDYKLISGLRPIGQKEKEFLVSLRAGI